MKQHTFELKKSPKLQPIQISNKWGYCNSHGEIIIPCHYDIALDFTDNGFAIVSTKGSFGLINERGDIIIAMEYQNILQITKECISVKKSGKWGVINLNNETIVPFIYNHIQISPYGMIKVRKDNKFGLFDTIGRMLFPIIYDTIHEINSNIFQVQINNKSSLVEINSMKTSGFIYDFVDDCIQDNMIRVCRNGKFGYVNNEINEIIPTLYDRAWPFYNEWALVSLDNIWFLLHNKGHKINLKTAMDKEYNSVINQDLIRINDVIYKRINIQS